MLFDHELLLRTAKRDLEEATRRLEAELRTSSSTPAAQNVRKQRLQSKTLPTIDSARTSIQKIVLDIERKRVSRR